MKRYVPRSVFGEQVKQDLAWLLNVWVGWEPDSFEDVMAAQLLPPSEVNLIYRNVGRTHVFTAMELPGFHIGSSKLEHAFNKATDALNEHVSKLYGCEATYQLEFEFEAFLAQIDSSMGPLMIARREPVVHETHAH